MHKKAKITSTRFKGIPAVLTAQGFHKGRLDCVEVSVIHCLDGIAINASSRGEFHRRRLALPSSSSTLLNPSTQNSSKQEEKNKTGRKSKTEEETKTQDKSKKQKRTKADTGDDKVEYSSEMLLAPSRVKFHTTQPES